MIEQYQVHLIRGQNDERATFTFDTDESPCRLTCSYRDKVLTAEADDYFEAFCRIREQMAEDRVIPFCYGASLNMYASSMTGKTGQGLLACWLALGLPPRPVDLRHIFAEGPDVIPVSVEMQKSYYDDWLKSLKFPLRQWHALRRWLG